MARGLATKVKREITSNKDNTSTLTIVVHQARHAKANSIKTIETMMLMAPNHLSNFRIATKGPPFLLLRCSIITHYIQLHYHHI